MAMVVPISLVMKREMVGKAVPLYLYGYGAYGSSLDPWFSHARLSLLDRGMAFAIAHVRGGGELGEAWYRAGKQEHKHNTFSDFIACAEFLILNGITTAPQLAISGGSAGGLLIGVVLLIGILLALQHRHACGHLHRDTVRGLQRNGHRRLRHVHESARRQPLTVRGSAA